MNDNESYDYNYLLSRVMTHLVNEEQATDHIGILVPILERSKRTTIIRNFSELCSSIYRSPEHVSSFISVELGHQTSLATSKGTLRIKGIYSVPEIERVLKSYVNTYVACKSKECLSFDTVLEREARTYQLKCKKCHHRYLVPSFRHLLEAQSTTRLLEKP